MWTVVIKCPQLTHYINCQCFELETLAIDVMGELGTLYNNSPHLRDNGGWQYAYMYYLGLIIGGGTSQIQKNIISERGLGLPKEPKIQGA